MGPLQASPKKFPSAGVAIVTKSGQRRTMAAAYQSAASARHNIKAANEVVIMPRRATMEEEHYRHYIKGLKQI